MSNNPEETIRVYTGPTMLAKGLVARLNELGITPIERNDNESSVSAGFSYGIAGQSMLFIRKDEMATAKETIAIYLNEIKE